MMVSVPDQFIAAVRIGAMAAGVFLYLLLMGWGLTRILLRRRILSYQLWLAPWFGLMLAVLPMLWLSRFGVSVGGALYPVTMLGLLFAGVCILTRVALFAPLVRLDRWLAAGALATLGLALYPMLFIADAPTTISLGNNDPALYAAAADFLELRSAAALPPPDTLHPGTLLVAGLLSPGHRPGTFLVLSLFDCLFHAPTYRVFSVLLAVLLALTTPLIAVFTHLVTGKRACAMIALALSAANVNFLYCYYHGFAAQILVQGCVVASFILVLIDELGRPALSYSIAIGLAIVAMIALVPEGAAFFLIPYLLYAASQFLFRTRSTRELVMRYAPMAAAALIAGLFPLWEGALWVRRISTVQAGWNLPRWALPIDMAGLMSVPAASRRSALIAAVVSIPLAGVMALGLARCHNRLLMAALAAFNIAVLFYFGAIRHYSYAYYKASVMGGFIFIAALAAGVPAQLHRHLAAICATLAILSFIACRPTIGDMRQYALVVTQDLSGLSKIPPSVTRGEIISVDRLRLWDRLWAINFMPDAALAVADPILPASAEPTASLALVKRSGRDSQASTSDVLWANGSNRLIRIKPR